MKKQKIQKIFVLYMAVGTGLPLSSAFAQSPASSLQRPASEVLELESEIGVNQAVREQNTKKEEKPSKSQDKPSTSKVQSPTSTIKPNAAYEQPKSVMKAAEKNTAGDIEGDLIEEKASLEEITIKSPAEVLTDRQVVQISSSLRELITENEELKKQLSNLDTQLRNLRGERTLEANRLKEISMERDALRQQTETIANRNSETTEAMRTLQTQLEEKEKEYNLQIIRLQTELANALRNAPDSATGSTAETTTPNTELALQNNVNPTAMDVSQNSKSEKRAISVEVSSAVETDAKSRVVMESLDVLQAERKQLIKDEAKIHYNMGNSYYNAGNYEAAAMEYRKTLEITPEDYNAHYNLAFVSGEFLNQPRVSINHYKQYLFLNPGAEDSTMVRQKIIDAEILVRGEVDFESDINEEVRKKKSAFNNM